MAASLPRIAPQSPKNNQQYHPPIFYPRPSNRSMSSFCEINNNLYTKRLPSPDYMTNTKSVSDEYIDNQLALMRRAAQHSFDSYMSQIRKIERKITLLKRGTDQKTKQTIFKTTDSISSLYSEIIQLNNTHSMLKRKVDKMYKNIHQNTQNGLDNATKSIKYDFQRFKGDFNESLSNINIIVKNLKKKISQIKKNLTLFNSFQSELMENNSIFDEININHICNIEKMKEIELDLNEDMTNDQKLRLNQFKLRLENLNLRIETLQQKANDAFNQSQVACETVQTGNFEIRTKFDEKMNQTMSNFKAKIFEIKKQMHTMNEDKYKSIEEINERVKKSKEMLAQIQKKKLKRAAESNETDSFSVKNDIKKIRQKVDMLEEIVAKRQNSQNPDSDNLIKNVTNSPKDHLAQLYFNYGPNNQVKVMIVIGGKFVVY